MGYVSTGFGTIQLVCALPEDTMDEFVELLGGKWLGIEVTKYEQNGTNYVDVSYWNYDDYYEEEFVEALDLIRSFVANGWIEFYGEENCHWRFLFDQAKGGWIKEDGVVIYNVEEALDFAQREFRRLAKLEHM